MTGISYHIGATPVDTSSTASSTTIVIPSGINVGDIVILGFQAYSAASGTSTLTVTSTGSTFEQIDTTQYAAGTPREVNSSVWHITAGASDQGATVTVHSSVSLFLQATVDAWSNPGSSPIDVVATPSVITTASSTLATPSVNTIQNNDWAIYVGHFCTDGSTSSTPTISVGNVRHGVGANGGATAIADNGAPVSAGSSIGGPTFGLSATGAGVTWTIGLAPVQAVAANGTSFVAPPGMQSPASLAKPYWYPTSPQVPPPFQLNDPGTLLIPPGMMSPSALARPDWYPSQIQPVVITGAVILAPLAVSSSASYTGPLQDVNPGVPLIPPGMMSPSALSRPDWYPSKIQPVVLSGSVTLAPLTVSASGSSVPSQLNDPGTPPIPPGMMSPSSLARPDWYPSQIEPVVITGAITLAPFKPLGTVSYSPVQDFAQSVPLEPPGKQSPQTIEKPTWFPSQIPPVILSGSVSLAPITVSGSIPQPFSPFPELILAIQIELLINGTWVDITDYVYQRDVMVITRGRPDETQQIQPQQITMTLDNRDGRFTPSYIFGAWYPYITRNMQIRVSINNSASSTGVAYTGYRFWGEVSEFPPQWDQTQSDVYVQIVASGILRRFVQGDNLGSAIKQYYLSLSNSYKAPYAYWPVEDASGSTFIGRAGTVVNVIYVMTIEGSPPPDFASCTQFGGSDPIAALTGSYWDGNTNAPSPPLTGTSGTITQNVPGTYYWPCPPGITSVDISQCIGSGGGGGFWGPGIGGGGGGGAENSINTSVAVSYPNIYEYVIPAGGSPGNYVNANGGDGGNTSFVGDSVTVTGHGGSGGVGGGGGGAGGTGGTGSGSPTHFNGGAGGAGQESTTSYSELSLYGSSGTAGAGDSTGSQTPLAWTSPITGTVTVNAQAAGGGGAGGGYSGYGGYGGGGGGYSTGTISVTIGGVYTFLAGNGGPGGPADTGSLAHTSGGQGANSTVSGNSGSVTADGGGGAVANSGGRSAGTGGSGNSANGDAGGDGVLYTGDIGGGGGGGDGGFGAAGSGGNASGRVGGAGTGAGANGGYGATATGASGATVGATATVNGGGGGGGGSTSSGVGNCGGGGAGGWLTWSWSTTSQTTGGGGGGTGGVSGTGNAGSNSGQGGVAVTGGSAGGNTGTTGGNPGGGGGGGLPAIGRSKAISPGSGSPGGITFSWSSVSAYPVSSWIFRFLLYVNPAGTTDDTFLAIVDADGYLGLFTIVYHTASGGSLEITGQLEDNTYIFDINPAISEVNGIPLMVSMEVSYSSEESSLSYTFAAIEAGSDTIYASSSGSFGDAQQLGNISTVSMGWPLITDGITAIGHITCQQYADPLTDLGPIIGGYAGETAAARLERLCVANNVPFTLIGNASDTPLMGPQVNATIVNLIQYCEDLDRGLLFEPRDSFGLAYRTRVSMQGQNPVLPIDYSLAQLANPLQPVSDDQYIRNDVTVNRYEGSSVTIQQTTGGMAVFSPPNGIGDYTFSLEVYAHTDSQLAPIATWIISTGTADGLRYPNINLDLARSEIGPIFATIADTDVGDFVQIANPPFFLTSSAINQLAYGFTENLNAYVWQISINAVPEDPYSEPDPPTW